MQIFCQYVLLVWMIVIFFAALHSDFYGRRAREPFGFSGAIISVVFTVLLFLMYWKAGAFSEIF